MTDEELQDAHDQVAADAADGLRNVSVDGMNVNLDSLKDRQDALDRAKKRKAARCGVLPIGITKVISRGLQ